VGKRSGEAARTPDANIAALQQVDAARVNDLAGKRTKHHGVSAIDPQRVARRSWFRSTFRESVLLALISYFAMSILYLTASGYRKTKDTAHIVGGYGGESVSQLTLKDKGFSTFLVQNPHLSYGRKMDFAFGKGPSPPNDPPRQRHHQRNSERQIARDAGVLDCIGDRARLDDGDAVVAGHFLARANRTCD
jgi:hypothetical protein